MLFDRYVKQWGETGPKGSHNVPRHGQLRLAGVTGKRSFRQFVSVKKVNDDADDDKGSDCDAGESLR